MQQQLPILLTIAASGALGAVARYLTFLAATALLGTRFPFGTLVVNVGGCFVMGVAAAALPEPADDTARSLWLRYGLMIGFLGAYTTFSAFGLDTLRQLEEGQAPLAAANILGNLVLSVAAVWLGLRLGQEIW